MKKLPILFFVFILTSCAHDSNYWVQTGNQYMLEGQYDKALDAYENLLKMDDPDPGAYAFIAQAQAMKYSALEENAPLEARNALFLDASVSFGKAIEVMKSAGEMYEMEILNLEASGRSNEASRRSRILETNIKPKLLELYYLFGKMLFDAGKFGDALINFSQASSVGPENLHVRYWCAMAVEKLADENDPRDLKRAIDVWESFIASSESNSIERDKYKITDAHLRRAKAGVFQLDNKLKKQVFKDQNTKP